MAQAPEGQGDIGRELRKSLSERPPDLQLELRQMGKSAGQGSGAARLRENQRVTRTETGERCSAPSATLPSSNRSTAPWPRAPTARS